MSDWHVLIFFISDGLEMPLSASFFITNGTRWLPPRHSFPRVSEPWEDYHPWSTVSWPGGPCGSGWSLSAQPLCLQFPVPSHPSHEGAPGSLETQIMVGLSRRPSSALSTSFSLESKSGSKAQCSPRSELSLGPLMCRLEVAHWPSRPPHPSQCSHA